MTNEEIRIAIAEACGLEVIHDPRGPIDTRPYPYTLKRKVYYTPTAADIRRRSWPNSCSVSVVPRYTECLNAMHEAEKTIPFPLRQAYRNYIAGSCINGSPFDDLHATALQRAEAFLRTLNLWRE